MRIAITGGIGSGKSFVCKKLNERGINIYDCDSGAKRLMRTSEELKQRLTDLIGEGTYESGTLNKAKVAEFLLASEENKLAINAIVHPAVIQDFYQSGLTWMETAILYEANLAGFVDKTICVCAPEDVRIQRIMKRDGISHERAKEWIESQMPQEEMARRSDFVIVNDGTYDLDTQINSILATLNAKH